MTRVHPVQIAAQRVYLTVVADHPKRVRQIPARKGIGGEALVNQSKRGNQCCIRQIKVILAYLPGQQHSFVDNGASRHGRHVELLAVGEVLRLDRMFDLLANNE